MRFKLPHSLTHLHRAKLQDGLRRLRWQVAPRNVCMYNVLHVTVVRRKARAVSHDPTRRTPEFSQLAYTCRQLQIRGAHGARQKPS
jgi:hypothetical protein